jgi:hypothetical protein
MTLLYDNYTTGRLLKLAPMIKKSSPGYITRVGVHDRAAFIAGA